jgi:hypothetical protein
MATETSPDLAARLDQLLGVVRLRQRETSRRKFTPKQRAVITRIALASGSADELPRQQGIGLLMEELHRHGIDVVIPWLRERLDYVRKRDKKTYIHPLPDDLAPLVRARRSRAAARSELARLLREIEKPATTGMYRFGVDEAITWLGGDSEVLTKKVGEWIVGAPRRRQLAYSFVNSGNWRTFTKRARLMLDARPNDEGLRRFLIESRRPGSWIGSLEPFFRSRVEEFSAWTRSKDPRVRALGFEAIAHYTREAEEAVLAERRERDRI